MNDGARIVAAARGWVGTPHRPRARARGRGVDCVGLIKQVGIETRLLQLQPGAGAAWAAYPRIPSPRIMGEALAAFLTPLEWPSWPAELPPPGIIAWLQWRAGVPTHLGIVGELKGRATLIHVLEGQGLGCVEHGFGEDWRARVAAFWRYPLMEF